MKNFNRVSALKAAGICLAMGSVALLGGCGSDDATDSMVSYDITVSNVSHNQPLSPIAVMLHDADYSAWAIGTTASSGLEYLAEGGDNSTFISDDSAMLMANVSGSAPVGPGGSDTLMLTSDQASDIRLTLASMLVNTNDAFTGMTGLDLSDLQVGESMSHYLPIYDAGTEANSEMAGTIPGPADGGEGYNGVRDDVNFVARHPGIVSQDDGAADSVLEGSHRFDSPIAMLKITRTQ